MGSRRSLGFSHTPAPCPTLNGQDAVTGPVSNFQIHVQVPFALLSPMELLVQP